MVDTQNLIFQNNELARQLQQRVEQLAAIGTVAATVGQSLDLDRTLSTALQAVLNVLRAEAAGISLIDEKAGEVVLRAQLGWTQDFVNAKPMRIPLGRGMSGRVIANDDVVVHGDLNRNEELAVPSFHDEHFRSIAMAPMHARGRIVGILSIMSYRPNHFTDAMVNVLRAIADTVGVALENARLYEASQEDQSRLSAVLHSTADGIIATDQAGRIRLVNQAAERMLGVDAGSLVNVGLREAPIQQKIRNSLLFALSSRSGDSNRVFQVTLEGGCVLSVLVSPVYVESQVEAGTDTDGWVIVLQDVTHLHQAEVARTEFIQAAAHDMRNPLGVALNSLEMLEGLLGEDETAREIIKIAMLGVGRIQDLIDDLLNLERIESGHGFNLTEIHIGELVNEVSAEIRPSLDEQNLTYSVEVEPDLPITPVDHKWVVRALLNYLTNACKYTRPGGHVHLRVFAKSPMIHIEVSDNGPGIPAELQARLFERFYRANAESHIPGTGLGLAIVKSVAEAHGGSVYVQSRPGQGSTFGMTLLMQNP